MAILNNNPLIGSGGQQGYSINNSLRFRSSASAYLSRTPSSAGNRKTWTWSAWVKRGTLGSSPQALLASTNNNIIGFSFTNADDFNIWDGNTSTMNVVTTQVFRDPSAWYHFVVAFDTTQATASNRVKIYVNGNQVTALSRTTYPTQNAEFNINNATAQNIGRTTIPDSYFDGYQTDVNFIDGQALTPSSFGETDTTTGVWKPKAYTGTYGTNGFYLKFSDIATTSGSNAGLGKDFSGNSNYWTTNNISVTSGTTYDAMTDSPTNTSATVANYCTSNPLNTHAVITTSGANLNTTYAGGAYQAYGTGTIAMSSNKYYWEVTVNTVGATGIGIFQSAGRILGTEGTNNTFDSSSSYIYFYDGKKYNGSSTGVTYGATYTTGDIIGIAFDADNGTLTFYKNNTSQGTAYTGLTSGPYLPSFTCYSGSNLSFNFGQRPFSYTPPTGFVALNTFNLPDSTIKKGSDYFGATLYTGTTTGTGQTQTISHGQSFTPNLVWIKNRSAAHSHQLYDVIRGYGSNKNLKSNATDEEGLYGDTNGYVSAVSSSQITTVSGSNATAYGEFVNQNTRTYVGWLWAANGAGVTNTSGSITSTVSVNTTAGFSVVTFTGNGVASTVGHGLGVAPAMIITKGLSLATSWIVYHKSLTNAQNVGLILNTTATPTTSTTYWNNTAPTSTVYSVGTQGNTNANLGGQVAYCWADVSGYSKAFSYTGNGSADGVFVYLGFRPAFVMLKNSNTTDSWLIKDDQRAANYNPANGNLYPNLSDAEDTGSGANIDFLSNGFKVRGSNISVSGNGNTIIGMAFAENPFKVSLAR